MDNCIVVDLVFFDYSEWLDGFVLIVLCGNDDLVSVYWFGICDYDWYVYVCG